MYSRKSARPRMEPSGTPALTGYSCEEFPSRTTWSHLLLRKEEIRPNMTWNSIRLMVVKKTSMPNSVESLWYIKCYSSSSPRPVKNPSNSIRQNCQKICSWSRRPKTILEIRKKVTFLYVIRDVSRRIFMLVYRWHGHPNSGAQEMKYTFIYTIILHHRLYFSF